MGPFHYIRGYGTTPVTESDPDEFRSTPGLTYPYVANCVQVLGIGKNRIVPLVYHNTYFTCTSVYMTSCSGTFNLLTKINSNI